MSSPAPDPGALHPALWRAHQLARCGEAVLPTGFAALDAQLPGGGWPRRALTELLLPHPGVGEMRLLAPALAAVAGPGAQRSVLLFNPPAEPCAHALWQLGVDTRQLIVVHGRGGSAAAPPQRLPARGGPAAAPSQRLPGHGDPAPTACQRPPGADVLWAMEQALRSGHAGAVLAWLPDGLRADALRRLQLAAQAHDGPAFVLRGMAARTRPSPAPLRLALHGSAEADELSVHVLKRRGPALAQPLRLLLPPVLPEGLKARARARRAARAVPRLPQPATSTATATATTTVAAG